MQLTSGSEVVTAGIWDREATGPVYNKYLINVKHIHDVHEDNGACLDGATYPTLCVSLDFLVLGASGLKLMGFH